MGAIKKTLDKETALLWQAQGKAMQLSPIMCDSLSLLHQLEDTSLVNSSIACFPDLPIAFLNKILFCHLGPCLRVTSSNLRTTCRGAHTLTNMALCVVIPLIHKPLPSATKHLHQTRGPIQWVRHLEEGLPSPSSPQSGRSPGEWNSEIEEKTTFYGTQNEIRTISTHPYPLNTLQLP